ncbi:glycosyltransferase family 2 protein [Litorimonas sp. RW-G-Af-16]|uniref:glycosyltransferase family 2 protein n=1 Tax=Litorimonas sp. RW-G-Af-16 TaxID=3241168 RepID=UPI00390C6AFF
MRQPRYSEKLGWANETRPHVVVVIICLTLLLTLAFALLLDWQTTLLSVTATVAIASLIFSVFRLIACLTPKPKNPETNSAIELPPYTVLVPLFDEANMVADLIKGLERLDYPCERLQILLICEAVDPETIAAVQAHLRPSFELIIVPKGTPQTKPRALNHAMQYASGALITIYDAEDRPHPQQLRTAAMAFAARPDWQALQAPLDYYNTHTNWLTQQFSLEYAALFHIWIPFLSRMSLPFPLGGTSNHMRREVLDAVGGWDPYNVTEDADLSFRLALRPGKIGYIDVPTDEEAVANLADWRLQRARWIKGFMQSWGVHMSAPFAPGGLRGIVRCFTLQVTLGFTLLSIWFYIPTLFILALIFAYFQMQAIPIQVPPLYSFSFGLSIAVGILIGMIGAYRARKPQLILSAVFMPLYWVLLFRPAMRALWELRYAPFHWHKTRHGVNPPPKLKTGDTAATPREADGPAN